MSEEQFGKELDARFPGCMAGKRRVLGCTQILFSGAEKEEQVSSVWFSIWFLSFF